VCFFFSSLVGPSKPRAGPGIVSKILPRLRRPGVQGPGAELLFENIHFLLPGGGPFGAARRPQHSFKNLTAPQAHRGSWSRGRIALRKIIFCLLPGGGPVGAARWPQHSFKNLTAPQAPRGSRFRVQPVPSFQAQEPRRVAEFPGACECIARRRRRRKAAALAGDTSAQSAS
jgi:hypothetical protein